MSYLQESNTILASAIVWTMVWVALWFCGVNFWLSVLIGFVICMILKYKVFKKLEGK